VTDENDETTIEVEGRLAREAIDASEAFAFRDSMADDPSQSAILIPEAWGVLEGEGLDILVNIRALTDSVHVAFLKAIALDVSEGDGSPRALGGTAMRLEHALMETLSQEPRAIVRILVQSMVDRAIDEADLDGEDEPLGGDAPVPANERRERQRKPQTLEDVKDSTGAANASEAVALDPREQA
jgi:hypothetical protein